MKNYYKKLKYKRSLKMIKYNFKKQKIKHKVLSNNQNKGRNLQIQQLIKKEIFSSMEL